jgi:hypothetical protein
MWTPVSVGTPPPEAVVAAPRVRTSTVDLQEQMQAMIDLQVLQQQHYATTVRPPVQMGRDAPDETTPVTRSNITTNNNSRPPLPPSNHHATATPAAPSVTISEPVPPPKDNYPRGDGVGRGTLLFPSHVLQQQQQHHADDSDPPEAEEALPPTAVSSLRRPQAQPWNNYGALTSSSTDHLASLFHEPSPNDEHSNGHRSVEQNPLLSNSQPPDYQTQQQPHHEHDFYYSHPDYPPHEERPHASSSRLARCCGCLLQPLVDGGRLLLTHTELHRAACWGAIDGLVTGASLVAALRGLHVWTDASPTPVQTWLIAAAVAVSAAEALSMGAGHVRTTQSQARTAWEQRMAVQLSVTTQRAAAKGHLVDVLLQRGLLKIDAMSVADTLEGYPDVVTALLAGEALADGGSLAARSAQDLASLLPMGGGGYGLPAHPPPGTASQWQYEDYEDPDSSRFVKQAVREAWIEALGMMVGFGVAAVVPALMVWVVPTPGHPNSSVTSSFMQPTTLMGLLLTAVMLFLGLAKARLAETPSVATTVLEAVGLLWLALVTAYGVGALLEAHLPDYLLTVATPAESRLYCV